MNVLVAYASKRGSTREVAEAVGAEIAARDFDVVVAAAATVEDIERFDAVVLGGALYMGRWHRDARHFLAKHRHALARRPFAVFGMGPQTMNEQAVAQSRAQLDRVLAKTPDVVPAAVAIFGGVFDPAKLRFPFNRIPATDARDWAAIEAWADALAARLRTAVTA